MATSNAGDPLVARYPPAGGCSQLCPAHNQYGDVTQYEHSGGRSGNGSHPWKMFQQFMRRPEMVE